MNTEAKTDPATDALYDAAFALKNNGQAAEAVEAFKHILEEHDDPAKVCPLLIASLYFYELGDHGSALPYARQAASQHPNHEASSICLVHCLVTAELHDEVGPEIQRYVATGGEVILYGTLFEENGLTAEDFKAAGDTAESE